MYGSIHAYNNAIIRRCSLAYLHSSYVCDVSPLDYSVNIFTFDTTPACAVPICYSTYHIPPPPTAVQQLQHISRVVATMLLRAASSMHKKSRPSVTPSPSQRSGTLLPLPDPTVVHSIYRYIPSVTLYPTPLARSSTHIHMYVPSGLMVHRMETLSSMNEDGRKVSAGEGRFAPPAVEQPDRARRKGGSSPTGGE